MKVAPLVACLFSASIAGTPLGARAQDASVPPAPASAQDSVVPPPPAAAPEPAAAPAAAPYSLPWGFRPVTVGNVVRLDQTLALLENVATHDAGRTWVTSLTVSRKLSPRLAAIGRISVVSNHPPQGAPSATAISNLVLGASCAPALGAPWRASGSFTVSLPVGQGGGDSPDLAAASAMSAAVPARSAMDNAVFAVNYLTFIAGADLACVSRNWTVQGEATVLRLLRARGPSTQDASRTNFTCGLSLGRFMTKKLSLGGELRYQRWLSDAAPARKDPKARDTATLAVGARLNLPLSGGRWIRPGLGVAKILDHPGSDSNYRTLQLDVPISF